MRVRSLQHVSSPFAAGGDGDLRAFYGELLGLRELPTPTSLGHLDLVWFAAGDGLELHFFSGETDPVTARHFCLEVEDLDETRQRLLDAGRQPYDDTPIPNRPRFFCRDPAGNLVEFTNIEGPYPGEKS
jgi:catechol 2,3-dioxygenase-like lactoylglutathione lyase family enzyme